MFFCASCNEQGLKRTAQLPEGGSANFQGGGGKPQGKKMVYNDVWQFRTPRYAMPGLGFAPPNCSHLAKTRHHSSIE